MKKDSRIITQSIDKAKIYTFGCCIKGKKRLNRSTHMNKQSTTEEKS